jgi:hypothetical protein
MTSLIAVNRQPHGEEDFDDAIQEPSDSTATTIASATDVKDHTVGTKNEPLGFIGKLGHGLAQL